MKVEFFDSHEAAAQRLRQAMEAADARVTPWQAALCPGDCILNIVEDGLAVFGEVLEGYQEPHLKHYRFCRCFSVACREGELGDVHVSTVTCRISRQFFEAMRQAGWAMEGPPAELGAPPPPVAASFINLTATGCRRRRRVQCPEAMQTDPQTT